MICSVTECDYPAKARNLCDAHYRRLLRGDALESPIRRRGRPLVERIEENSGPPIPGSGCIPWRGWTHRGYAALGTRGGRRILVFHVLVPDVPEGFIRDHRCRNRACVNPAHIRIIPSPRNAQNRGVRNGARSGYRGVTQGPGGKWQGRYMVDGKSHSVGLFDTAEEASVAVSAARREAMPYSVEGS